MTYQYDVRLSKRLSWLLRHGVESRGLKLRPDGFLELEKVLKLKDFASYTSEDIEHVVEWNNKKRFGVVRERGRITLIRAVQGHSVHVDEEQLLTKIDQADAVPMCIHGTYYTVLESVIRHGINRMMRTHIHFSPGFPGEGVVISGLRRTAEVAVLIDIKAAMAAGLEFYRSENNVILTSGLNGIVPPEFISEVVDVASKKRLPITWTGDHWELPSDFKVKGRDLSSLLEVLVSSSSVDGLTFAKIEDDCF